MVGEDHTAPQQGIILAIARQWPWPFPNGLTVRIIELLKQLCKHKRVVLISPESSDPHAADEPYSVISRIKVSATGDGWIGVPKGSTADLVRAAAEALEAYKPEALIVWGDAKLVRQLRKITAVPLICDRVDCYTLGYWRDVTSARGLRAFGRAARELVKTAVRERSLAFNSDAILLVGEKDANTIRSLAPGRRVVVIPNGAPLKTLRSENELSKNPSIIFSGVLEYPPNIDAATYFARDIFPIVRKKLPQATFIIAGRKPTEEILKLAEIEGVIIKGDVPDMAETLKNAWISVAPMRTGAGIKNKVLEAWAVGVPVVLSTVAANGLSLPPVNINLVFDTAQTFADGVLSLLNNQPEILSLGSICWQHVRSHQSWDKIGDDLSDLIDRLVQDRA